MSINRLKEFKIAFELFDSKNNGKISKNELKNVMQSLDQNIGAEQLNKMAYILLFFYFVD